MSLVHIANAQLLKENLMGKKKNVFMKKGSFAKMRYGKKKLIAAAAVKSSATVFVRLDVLRQERERWEGTKFKTAMEGLFALLGKCLDIYVEKVHNASKPEKAAFRDLLKTKLHEAGVETRSTSNMTGMLVRYVFSSDRKRAHGYARVISAAIADGVSLGKNLPGWIRDQGGIEEIKRSSVTKPDAVERKEKRSAAEAEVKRAMAEAADKPLATVEMAGLTGEYVVFLARPNVNGGADIVGTVNDAKATLINALVKNMSQQYAEKSDECSQLSMPQGFEFCHECA
jgi:hypothetical protein